MTKIKLTLSIDRKVVNEMKKRKINISEFLEQQAILLISQEGI